jgi:hypothetical protein
MPAALFIYADQVEVMCSALTANVLPRSSNPLLWDELQPRAHETRHPDVEMPYRGTHPT